MRKNPFKNHVVLLLLSLVWLPASLHAQGAGRRQVLEGNRLYAEGKYDQANDRYRDAEIDNPSSPIVKFNIGDALYQKRNYEAALQAFQEAIQKSDDPRLQAESYYNLGNTLYRLNKWPESILAYQQALKLNPNDADAKYNLEYVRAKLKQHAQKQPPQQQQQQQQQQEPQQGQQNQDQQKQQGQEEQQQQAGQQSQEQSAAGEQQENEAQAAQGREHKLSKEEAERLLEALQKQEKDAQKQRRVQARGRARVEKDW
ncbi:MAG: tetratricopeptide repeat protein [candidate division KSB1 bacterium]|nr:tetratricopeptide repeat protein [candidate division KSB1 bacterium]MDZ7274511.1 tetratricopeptide repeat protein [candidate division KSB1 bacterium]MDZ7284828.1 tetratricopeptide repeat protein [candidate division KSB1 bacterium]MDZ7297752.1 tetratricopeptide repeat protein [candidate division KSB1 bacterium]MDZ7308683.1 tetratricopeptide repeat protein [candidate division KSB1 bacterium]